MATRPLNPEGGRAEKLFFIGVNGSCQRVDRIAHLRGYPSRSAFLREKFEQMMRDEEAKLLNEEASQAS